MATRSNVAIMYSESNCKSIYVHLGGRPKNGIGETLFNYYQDLQKIEKAISLGNASALLEEIETSKFCLRDFLYDNEHAFEGTLQQIQDRMSDYDTEYLYVYDVQNKQWLYKPEGEIPLQPLKNVFKQ